MLQRIQTIYLVLAATATGLALYFPFALYYSDNIEAFSYGAMGITDLADNLLIQPGNWFIQVIVLIASVLITLYAIFSFKHRKRQLRLGQFNYLLLVAVIMSVYFSVKSLAQINPIGNVEDLKTIYWIGFYLPVASLAFQFLANRGIKKDEALVKSVERLRG